MAENRLTYTTKNLPGSNDDPGTKPPNNVLSGDLENLWKVANEYLPTVEHAYNKQINNVNDAITGEAGDGEPYGPCHKWWNTMAQTYRSLLWHTSMSLSTVSILMNQAIDEYKYVDGSGAKTLTDIGKELEYITDKTDPVEPEEISDDFGPNDIDFPSDWDADLDDVNKEIDDSKGGQK